MAGCAVVVAATCATVLTAVTTLVSAFIDYASAAYASAQVIVNGYALYRDVASKLAECLIGHFIYGAPSACSL